MQSLVSEQPCSKHVNNAEQSLSCEHFSRISPHESQMHVSQPSGNPLGPLNRAPSEHVWAADAEASGKPPLSEAGCPMPALSTQVIP